MNTAPGRFFYSPWRHGGWYVRNIRYPSGAIGCVSRNYPDGKWRIACDKRENPPTFRTRDEAAMAEWLLVEAMRTPGQIAYERDLARQPFYPDGEERPAWWNLPGHARFSWDRNPTDR